jgi:hypothetical protein
VTGRDGKEYKEKNYNGLEPVITFVWMVDDTLNFKDDFVVFSTLPEVTKDFITNAHLWTQPLNVILSEREKVLTTLQNTTKELDFFSQNRLIYGFQQNIIANNNYDASYFPWFDFAQTSRKHDNTENDFLKFKNSTVMAELINRLKVDKFTSEELMYLSGNYEIEMDLVQTQKREAQLQIELKAEREKCHADLLKGIKKLLNRGETISDIADFYELPVEEITAFVKEIEDKDREETDLKRNHI